MIAARIPGYLVGTDRCADTATADRHATLHLSRGNRARQRNNEIGIVICRVQVMRAEIDDLMPRCAQVRDKLLLQTKSAVIRGNANAHVFPFVPVRS